MDLLSSCSSSNVTLNALGACRIHKHIPVDIRVFGMQPTAELSTSNLALPHTYIVDQSLYYITFFLSIGVLFQWQMQML